jgi:hypothetical protein
MTTTLVTTAAKAARGTYIDAIAVGELFADPTYQRPVDAARARKLAASWDRRLAGVIEVSDRGPGKDRRYAIIDGQHRWQAAQLLDPAPMMVATIHEGLTVADEARLFDRINRERRRPSTWDHWHARKGAADTDVLAIEQVAAELGLTINSAPEAGNVRCTATLEKLHKLGGIELVQDTLKLIVDIWDTRLDAFDAPIVHGIGLVLHHLRHRIDLERLADTLLDIPAPRHLKTRALALGETTTGTQPVLTAITVMFLYNKNRNVPGEKILVSARTFGGGARNARSLPPVAKTA